MAGGKGFNKSAGGSGALITAAGLVISVLYASPEAITTVNFRGFHIGKTPIELSFHFDTLTCIMLVIVHFVALLVQLYSVSVLPWHTKSHRYFALYSAFPFLHDRHRAFGQFAGDVYFLGIGGTFFLFADWVLVSQANAVWAAQKAFCIEPYRDPLF